MYLQFFGLTEAPFSITPDPAFVYLSARHRDALAHLLYGVGKGGAGGFVQLTGEVGTGKTTICRCLLEQVPENTRIALILNPMLTPMELLISICEELGIDVSSAADSSKALVDTLNAYLLAEHAQGRRVVVVIDEAQNLSPEALEQVRLLTNLETAKDKLLQMVLLGQPELRQLLQRQDLRQLAQRITARYHLEPLEEQETYAYVRHRMQVAGVQRNPFRNSALRALYQRSGGVPRLINIIADRALSAAYAAETPQVSARMVHAAANEVQPGEKRVRGNKRPWLMAASVLLVLVSLPLFFWGLPLLDTLRQHSDTQPIIVVSREPGSRTSSEIGALLETPHGESPVAHASNADAENAQTADNEPTQVGGLSESTAQASAAQMQTPQEQLVMTPDKSWLNAQHSQVWQGMASLWNDEANALAIHAACAGETGTGYACLRDFGSWSRVFQLGLPVVLVLHGSARYSVILRGTRGEQLLLGADREPVMFTRDQIEPLWLGEFLVIWPQAPDWPLQIRRGESGAAVNIVMQMAALAEPEWQGEGAFDAGFESWLMTFQRRNGLTADGIVGPKTLLYLMAPTISEPRLVVSADERS